jgi:hypothetical protein
MHGFAQQTLFLISSLPPRPHFISSLTAPLLFVLTSPSPHSVLLFIIAWFFHAHAFAASTALQRRALQGICALRPPSPALILQALFLRLCVVHVHLCTFSCTWYIVVADADPAADPVGWKGAMPRFAVLRPAKADLISSPQRRALRPAGVTE